MSNSKKKKQSSTSLPAQSVKPSTIIPLDQNEQKLDDEPKVSFTLEFYAVDEKSTSFIGRLKKIGSEEQVGLIKGLDAEKIIEFLERNLPKAWQEKTKITPPAEIQLWNHHEDLDEEAGKPGLQPMPPQESMPFIQLGNFRNNQKSGIEVWQNGQVHQTIRAELPVTVLFETGEHRLWQSVDAHFKSLEHHVPDCSFSKHNIFAEKISLELSAGQLNAGIYSLSLRAISTQGLDPDRHSQVSANQIIQVI